MTGWCVDEVVGLRDSEMVKDSKFYMMMLLACITIRWYKIKDT